VFSLRNILGPLKFLASILLGYRYITREQRLNNQKLEELWKSQGLGKVTESALKRKATFLGFSVMLLKSAILALVGLLACAVFILWRQRKQRALKLMEEQEQAKRARILEEAWERAQRDNQPDLSMKKDADALTAADHLR